MNEELRLREDWVEIELGELCKFSQGVQVPKGKQYTDDNENRVRFLRIIDFTQGKDEPRYIDKPNDINIVAKDDISMVRYGATTGFVCSGISGAIANNIFRIIPEIRISKRYLYFFFKSPIFYQTINSRIKGAAMPAISFGLIKPIIFPLPPLVKQKAIVKKIEALFSSLDSGIADLKKAQDQLVIYRQAVLKKAFEGEFKKVKLEDACDKATKVKRKEMDINEPLLYLDIGGIDNKTNIIFSHKKYTWENAPSRAQQIVKVGDVLFSTVRTYLKNIAQVNNPIYNDEIASSGFTIIRGKKDLLNPKFIFFITTSQFFLEPLNKLQRGTSYPAVRDKDVFSQLIPLPTLEEQQLIVKEIESRLSVCDTVEKDIADSLEKAQALRQSILKKAFEGTLLSEEEIAKCKADAAYEPASVLLEKIKTEKLKSK